MAFSIIPGRHEGQISGHRSNRVIAGEATGKKLKGILGNRN